MLYPQNGGRVVAIDTVTSLHAVLYARRTENVVRIMAGSSMSTARGGGGWYMMMTTASPAAAHNRSTSTTTTGQYNDPHPPHPPPLLVSRITITSLC